MVETVVSLFVGIVCIVLGVSNMRGNISSIHSYHRNRVKEEDVIPFGRLVGLGTILIGVGIIVFGGMTIVTNVTENDFFLILGIGILIVAVIIGLCLSFYAMIKYNKGIF